MTNDFTDALRALPDEALGALLRLRPDLLVPLPADTTVLASRAQSKVSISRALDDLDQFTLEILDGLRLLPDPSMSALLALTNNHEGVPAAVGRLRARLLVYGDPGELFLAHGIHDACSPFVAGLGRPAAQLGDEIAGLMADPAKMRRVLMSAPAPARAVLDRLAQGPPVGTTLAGSESAGAEAAEWLIERNLLAEVSEGVVELPRELGLLLRRESGPLGQLHPAPPEITSPGRDVSAVDKAGAGQAMSAVRHVEELMEALAADPVPVLRGGGFGVLPLRKLAKLCGLSEQDAAVFLEIAYAAGLAGELETAVEAVFTPAAGYDLWRAAPLAERWTRLAKAWLAMPRQPFLAGSRDEKDRPMTVFSAQLERSAAPEIRRTVLEALREPGLAPTLEELIAVLRWHTPRRMRTREGAHRSSWREAGLLGLLGAGALTSYGRVLLTPVAGDPLGIGEPSPSATEVLDALLPPPVDHLLVQADLTVVVPGPAEPGLAAELDAVAEHESGGGASVYRVTQASVRRALDTGYTAHDLHTLFKRRSRTPVPQGLTYMIDDVARTHGGLRTGASGAYLRSEDEALIAAALADRQLADLQLRRIAPTVLVTPFTAGRLLQSLRESGYAPVPEDSSGATVLSRPKLKRAAARPALQPNWRELSQAALDGVVEDLRRGDARMRALYRAPAEVRAAAGHPMSSLTAVQAHSQALSVLQQAVRDKVRVWVGYVDAHGSAASRLVRPVSIGAGYLRAEDERTQMLHTFALHRITAAAPAD
jgi:hypothetical protein